MKERNIQNSIRLACGKGDTRLFVNDVGMAEIGGTLIRYGLCTGSTDLVGVHSVVITPDMIGRKIGVAVFAEVKTEKGIVKPHQEKFIKQMTSMGCISGVVRSVQDMKNLLSDWYIR